MYEIQKNSRRGLSQQYQTVNQSLTEEIKGMHGLQIFTSVPKH